MMELKDKVAIVTGASSGIGSAIAVKLAKHGCKVAIIYYNSKQGAEETASKIQTETKIIRCDVADMTQVQNMVNEVVSAWGNIDILINNAGIIRDRAMRNLSEEHWDEVIAVNLKGPFNCCKTIHPHLNENGRIINISSLSGQTGLYGQCNYSSSKAGLIGFTKVLARELAKHNVTVNAIAPGLIKTRMTESIPKKFYEALLEHVPLKRAGTPEDVAKAVLFLVKDAPFITGQVLSVNGGAYM